MFFITVFLVWDFCKFHLIYCTCGSLGPSSLLFEGLVAIRDLNLNMYCTTFTLRGHYGYIQNTQFALALLFIKETAPLGNELASTFDT